MPSTFPTGTYPHMIVNTSGIVHYMRFGESTNSSSVTGDDADSLTGYLYNGVFNGGSAIAGDSNNSMGFDGVNDYITFGDTNRLAGAFTMEVWVYPATNYTSGYPTFLSKENWNVPYSGWSFYLDASGGSMIPKFARMAGGNVYRVQCSAIGANSWTHLAATYDNATLRMYKNGTLHWETPSSPAMYESNYPFVAGVASNINATYFSDRYFGYLDELAIYNRALSGTELTDHYNRALTPPIQYVSLSDSPTVSSNRTFSIYTTRSFIDDLTLGADDNYYAVRGTTLTDTPTLIGTDTNDGIITEFMGDKLFFSDSATVTSTESSEVDGYYIPYVEYVVSDSTSLFESKATTTLADSGTLTATESSTVYLVRDSRMYPRVARERMGLLNRTVHSRFENAQIIELDHHVIVRLGVPESNYFVVLSNIGQILGLGTITTTWNNTTNHTTITFFDDPFAHPDILSQFEIPAQYVG